MNYPPPYQDAETLAAHLCVCAKTIRAWADQGIIPPPVKRGGRVLWKWSAVEKSLDERGQYVSVTELVTQARASDAHTTGDIRGAGKGLQSVG